MFYNRSRGAKGEVVMRVKFDGEDEERRIVGERGKIVMLKSRKCEYGFENTGSRKRFVCVYWVNGARDLNNSYF